MQCCRFDKETKYKALAKLHTEHKYEVVGTSVTRKTSTGMKIQKKYNNV